MISSIEMEKGVVVVVLVAAILRPSLVVSSWNELVPFIGEIRLLQPCADVLEFFSRAIDN